MDNSDLSVGLAVIHFILMEEFCEDLNAHKITTLSVRSNEEIHALFSLVSSGIFSIFDRG